MLVSEMLILSKGNYKLTDNLYKYDLVIGCSSDGEKFYRITEVGGFKWDSLFMVKDEDEGGDAVLSGCMSVGGLHLHSNDLYMMLSDLSFIPRGSFLEMVKIELAIKEQQCKNK